MRMLLGVEKSNVADSGPRDGKSVKADVFVRRICNCLDARKGTLNSMRKSAVTVERCSLQYSHVASCVDMNLEYIPVPKMWSRWFGGWMKISYRTPDP